jgi:hypothetical protein
MNYKNISFKKFRRIFPEWGRIEVGVCGFDFNRQKGYLYGCNGESKGNAETYMPLKNVVKYFNNKKASVTYRIEMGVLKYFYLEV